jgi:cell division septal protein FtsQ
MKKRIITAITLLLLLTTYKPEKLPSESVFNINEIKIENNFILKDEDIKKELIFLYKKNLFFLNYTSIKIILKNLDFIESFELKKSYPNTITIKIFEKTPIAILHHKNKKFYIDKNIDLIGYTNLDNYSDLPLIFGNKKDFKVLYENLENINFPLNLIKKYYFLESNRWNLETYEKNIIKLPSKNYTESLQNFLKLKNRNNFDKHRIFDYRINNQLILK